MHLSSLSAKIDQLIFEKAHIPPQLDLEQFNDSEKRALYSTLRLSWLFWVLIEQDLKKIVKKKFLRKKLCALMVVMELKIYGGKPDYYLSSIWQDYLKKQNISWLFKPTWSFVTKLSSDIDDYKDIILSTQRPGSFLIHKVLKQHPNLKISTLFSHPPLWCLIHKKSPELTTAIEEKLIHHSPMALSASLLKSTLNPAFFQRGDISYQDIATQYTYELLQVLKGIVKPKVIIDTCASPGGKTILLEKTWPKAQILATDINDIKIQNLKNNVQRVLKENHHINCRINDWTKNSLDADADIIICDLPCTGTGVLRKHPDILWAKDKTHLDELKKTQRDIVHNALFALKDNGYLIIATCSLLDDENSELINEIINTRGKDYTIEEVEFSMSLGGKARYGWQIMPSKTNDGIYYCLLKKVPRGTSH